MGILNAITSFYSTVVIQQLFKSLFLFTWDIN